VEVTLTHGFVIKQTEVTQADWEAIGFPNPDYDKDPELPFRSADWYEALAFCNALSEKEGFDTCYSLTDCEGQIGGGCPELDEDGNWICSDDTYRCDPNVRKYPAVYDCPGYRLPTRAEWQYAARAGVTAATHNGDVITDYGNGECVQDLVLEPIAWYCHNSGVKPQRVAQKRPNNWGLYDMIGNVSEWINDVDTGLSLEADEGEPGPLVDPIGAPAIEDHPLRGNSGSNIVSLGCQSRSAWSGGSNPELRISTKGFRPVRTVF